MRVFWLSLLALLLPSGTQGEWREAQTTNFVIYADDSERDLIRFAQRLERYHVALAEAEFDAGNAAEAIAVTDRAIALDWRQVNAYVQKGFALFRQASEMPEGEERSTAYQAAVEPFLALNRVENDHPLPLYYFHHAYAEGGEVPAIARAGLARAVELAPFDLSLRMALVQQQLRDGELALAAGALRPIAFAAHGGWLSEKAAQVIAQIDAGAAPEMAPALLELLTSAPPEATEPAEGGAA